MAGGWVAFGHGGWVEFGQRRWVEFGHAGALWPAAGLSFVTAGSGGWVEFRDGGARSWPAAGLRGSSPRLEELWTVD